MKGLFSIRWFQLINNAIKLNTKKVQKKYTVGHYNFFYSDKNVYDSFIFFSLFVLLWGIKLPAEDPTPARKPSIPGPKLDVNNVGH